MMLISYKTNRIVFMGKAQRYCFPKLGKISAHPLQTKKLGHVNWVYLWYTNLLDLLDLLDLK